MAKATFKSILGGIAPTYYYGQEDTFNSSLGIDPDFPTATANVKSSGVIVPVAYTKFSGSNISGFPNWITTNNKDTKTYVYASDGKFVSYDSNLENEALVGTPTSGAGNGMAYYNNFIYLATPTDVSRYGPLDGTPALTNTVWTGATLGSQTALTNTSYPSLQGNTLPNHPMFVHADGSLYFGDYKNGQGLIHRINTKKGTNEGDTNGTTVPSAYNALDLPFGYAPTCISNWGNFLAIGAIQTSSSATVIQGKAKLFLWDVTDVDSFALDIPLADPLVTALLNVNGVLYVWSGNTVNGFRLSKYIGGISVSDVCFFDEGMPPFPGGVEAIGNRVYWGGFTTYPSSKAVVFSYYSKNAKVPMGLHCPIVSTSAGATQMVFSLKQVQQDSAQQPKLVVGWGDSSAKGIDKYSSSATISSVWRSKVVNIGENFTIRKIKLPLAVPVAGNMFIVPKIFFDSGSSSITLRTINNVNYPLGDRYIIQYSTDWTGTNLGKNDFFLELTFSGTVSLPVTLPITVELDLLEP